MPDNAPEPKADTAGVTFPPPFVFVGMVLLGLAADRLLALPGLPLGYGLRMGIGTPLLIVAMALIALAIGLFARAGNDPEPWKPVDAFVATGVYRITRNPMYLGMAAFAAGLAIMMGSIGALVSVPIAMVMIDRFVIAKEEAYLDRRFGQTYRDYKSRVRRWI